jgi:pyruvate-formate lyase-activating enzyme
MEIQTLLALEREQRFDDMLLACERALSKAPEDIALRFLEARAFLYLGRLAAGEAQMNTLWSLASSNPALEGLPAFTARQLFAQGFWEQARPWLRIARTLESSPELDRLWELSSLPAHLAPEVYCDSDGETVLRYAPRESRSYVYAIDIVGTCNLACPSCPVANSADEGRAKGTMPMALFKEILAKILRESPSERPEVWLYNWGEPTLHPNLGEILALLRARGLKSMVSSNLNYSRGLTHFEQALPDVLKISLSGFSPGTYAPSHTGGNIQLVQANMHRLAEIVARADTPCEVWVGHHLYRHNLHEREEVREACEALGFQWRPIQAFWQPIEKLLELEEQRSLADPLLQELLVDPLANAAHVRQHRKHSFDCELRFNQTVINVDGSVSLCCSTYSTANRLQGSFLDESHASLETQKYSHGFCRLCRKAGFDYSLSRLPESLRG